MSTGKGRPALPVNSLLGMALLVAAGLNILLVAGIGWAAWERATLSQAWDDLRTFGPLAEPEAAALLDLIAGTESALSEVTAALPTDADVARFVAALRTEAAAAGVAVTNLSAEPAPAGPLPRRLFLVEAEGDASRLLALLTWTAQQAPRAARIEEVTLTAEGTPPTLSFRLLTVVRQSGP